MISCDDEAPKKEKKAVVAPTRCLARLLRIKRKNYMEKTPKYMSADYGGYNDWEDDRSPGSWGAVGRGDNDEYYG